ncbi:DUF3219 family protein [Sporosarcina thermotolerans]|uniref:DUF3219 family protein n=1 Tax=Sporosarcina thermotolerans TaxID=633404 RepID=A0AAW9AD05_9BACL|nr:DUF3219 family protein [Sporosarcina thermotolerans]MDW0117523.1 DUF3219 family protein [Sporosarcina thermotolerans]WHT49687.1 DUF3219 family protein [Sporosarcina thermotolerans]
MVQEIRLNDTIIKISHFEKKKKENKIWISVTFNVTNEEYHDITTLLYKGTFDVKVPEKQIEFRGTIQQYSTSITNLYEKGNVGEYKLTLKEVEN